MPSPASILQRLASRFRNDDGQAIIEYAPILVLVSIAAVLVLTEIGDRLVDLVASVPAAFP